MPTQSTPTLLQHERIQRDHAARYAKTQRDAHQASLREVIAAGERAAHFSRGYTPEQPSQAQELRPLDRLARALWIAFGVGVCGAYLWVALGAQS